MIVFGGASGNIVFKTGGRYNPATNSWKATNSQTAPVARSAHAAVWTGAEMIVFGGSGNAGWLNSGGRYNPATDSWLATPTNSAPTPRELPAAVWTGNEMIVWGGATANFDTNTGARFNPSTNTWKPTSLNNAPSARNWTAALWTGSRMLIWGGQTYSGVYNYHNDGALYDPATDTWTPTSMTNAPSPRAFFGYVWTGTEMIAWSGCSSEGGFCSTPTITGGRYDPNIDAWRETTTVRVPAGRYEFPAAWTGDKMIVWGGIHEHLQILPSGGVYTPGP
jgi:N-acetylneuraminic acid mutarotase